MEPTPGSKRSRRRSVIRSVITAGLVCHVACNVPVSALQSGHRAPASQRKEHHPHLSARQLAAPRVWRYGTYQEASGLTWSPDGRWAAYSLCERPKDSERTSLCCIRADGKRARRLYTQHDRDDYEADMIGWSPDGRHVLYWEVIPRASSVNADGSRLFDASVRGSKPRLLTIPIWCRDGFQDDHMMRGPHTLVFSPNGRSLLLVRGLGRFDTENKRLALLTYPAGKQRWLTGPNVAATWPVWSPDGKQIAYLACPDTKRIGDGDDIQWRKAHRHLWITDTEGHHQRQLTGDTHYQELAPRWLPGSRIIRFTRQENTPDGNGKKSQWEINVDGTGLRQIDVMTADTGTSRRTAVAH